MGINSLSSNGQRANLDITKDLIQRIKELSSKFNTIEKEFADIGPAMETIISIRDQLHNIEKRTISIVDQFQDQIFGMEDKADQIIIILIKKYPVLRLISMNFSVLLRTSEISRTRSKSFFS